MTEHSVKPSAAAVRVVHDLGLAACLGGTLFGKAAFNPSVAVIGAETERGRLGAAFWNRANVINAAAFGAAAAAWLPARLGGPVEDPARRTRGLILAKDLLMGAAATAGLAAVAAQVALNRQAPQGAVPLETGGVPAPVSSGTAALLQRAVGALGSMNVALFASLVAVSAVLSAEAGGPRNQSDPRRPRHRSGRG